MKKDIIIPQSKGVKLAIIPMANDAWDLYLINEKDIAIRNVLVVTTALKEGRTTSTLRYFLETMAELSFIKFETIYGKVMDFENNVTVTYYIGIDIYDVEFIFSKKNLVDTVAIQLMERQGFVFE